MESKTGFSYYEVITKIIICNFVKYGLHTVFNHRFSYTKRKIFYTTTILFLTHHIYRHYKDQKIQFNHGAVSKKKIIGFKVFFKKRKKQVIFS